MSEEISKNSKKKDTSLGMIAHILGIFTGFIGALVIYLIAEDDYTKNEARKALNWQISLIIYFVISGVLMLILIGFLLMVALSIMNFVVCIIAAIKANEGKDWDYPLSISFLK